MVTMQKCPNCGASNRIGMVFCDNCGASLIGSAPISTRTIDESEIKADSQKRLTNSDDFKTGMLLRVQIPNAEPMFLRTKAEVIIGRRDPSSGNVPDLDLTPFAGYRMGVSRSHCAIRQTNDKLEVFDLGSSNGTFLNGVRLTPHRGGRLHDGDELRLGQMAMMIFFHQPEIERSREE
jgi:pSer/pThr/pTyr-binding forkhead associated (FHA) protein